MPLLSFLLKLPRVFLVWALVAGGLLVWHPDPTAAVHFASTSLANLAAHPLSSIGLSVFTLANGWGEWATWVGLSLVWVLVERRLGWRCTLALFAAGHVFATLGVALFQALAVAGHLAGTELVHVVDDVGASYGFLALAAAGLTIAARADRRWLFATPLVVAISVIDVGWWTILGHSMAITVGVTVAVLAAEAGLKGAAVADGRQASASTATSSPLRTSKTKAPTSRSGGSSGHDRMSVMSSRNVAS
jgi:hypothetical protein